MSRELYIQRAKNALANKPHLPHIPMVSVNTKNEMHEHWTDAFHDGGVCFVRETNMLFCWCPGIDLDPGEWIALGPMKSKKPTLPYYL